MRIITLTIFLLVVVIISVAPAQAQKCGGGFAHFTVTSDSTGKVVPRVTIEIIANFYEEDYLELLKKYKEGRMLNENERSFESPNKPSVKQLNKALRLRDEKITAEIRLRSSLKMKIQSNEILVFALAKVMISFIY